MQNPQFPSPTQSKKSGISTPVGIIIALIAVCGMCGLFGGIAALFKKDKPAETVGNKSNTNQIAIGNVNNQPYTPTPTPAPPTFAQLKQTAEALLNLDKEEYTQDDIKPFLDLSQQLNAIPTQAKEHNEAKKISKKLTDKVIRLAAERIVLGPKPVSGYAGKVYEVDQYLSKTLNDYDDSEYLEWTPVKKLELKGEPYWAVGLKLRAKNGFGAKIVKDVVFFIRDGQVVKTTGL